MWRYPQPPPIISSDSKAGYGILPSRWEPCLQSNGGVDQLLQRPVMEDTVNNLERATT